MRMFKSITIVLVLWLLPACVVKAASTSELLQQGLYAEEVDGNIDAAIKTYEQIIKKADAPRNHAAQALYRQGMCYLKTGDEQSARAVLEKLVTEYADQNEIVEKARPSLEDLMNFDPASLMPANTLVYMELGSPGKQVETILNMLKETPYENPLAAVGGRQNGQKSPGDIVGALLNPSMLAEFKKVRGGAIGITGIAQNHPPMIAVLYPGKSDALRGVIMAALNMAGGPDEPIEGMQTINIQNTTWVAYDDKVILAGMPKEQLIWSVKQYKGLISEPTLASSNPSFPKINKKQRQNSAMIVWANVDDAYARVLQMFPPDQVPKEIGMVNTLVDFSHIDYITYTSSIEPNGLSDVLEIEFKEGHNCLAYDLIRTPNISKSALEAVPAEAVALVSFALSGQNETQAETIRSKIKNVTGLDIGREIFANIEQVTIFAVPPDENGNTGISALPSCFGVAITSHNPQGTRQILATLLATAGTLSAGQPVDINAGQFQIGIVKGQKLICYMNQVNKTTILSLNRNITEASVAAVKNKTNVCTAGPLSSTVGKLPPSTSKLIAANAGGVIRIAAPFIAESFEEEQRRAIKNSVDQLALATDKTNIEIHTTETLNSFTLNEKLAGIPPLNQVFGPVTQIVETMKKAESKTKAAKLRLEAPATIVPAAKPTVIDGNEDEAWSAAPRYKIANVMYAPLSSPNDLSAAYKAMWDENNLYLLVDVTDDLLVNDTSPEQTAAYPHTNAPSSIVQNPWWFDDCVEVYIDADNSKSDKYDNDDYQYHFDWDRTNPTMGVHNQHGRLENVEFAMATTDDGYRVEIKFPWATLGRKPATGATIGLDVMVNDDDNGGERDSKIAWHSKQDNTWENPQEFGNAALAGMLGWWKFDETEGNTAKDNSGGNHNGTLVGGAKWAPGKIGGAIELDGSSGFVQIADKSAFDITGQVSIACWVNIRSVPKEWTAIVTKGDSSWRLSTVHQERKFHFSVNDYTRNAQDDIVLNGSTSVNANEWHNVAAVYNGSEMRIYVDGKLDATKPWAGGIAKNDFDVLIGENAQQKGRFFDGLIDDVRIYNYALSEKEVADLATGK